MKHKFKRKKRDFTVLSFSLKHKKRILTKKSLYGYEGKGMWMNYKYLIKSSYWNINAIKINNKTITIGTMMPENMIVKAINVEVINGEEQIFLTKEKSKVPMIGTFLVKMFANKPISQGYTFSNKHNVFIGGHDSFTFEEMLSSDKYIVYSVINTISGREWTVGMDIITGVTSHKIRRMEYDSKLEDIALYDQLEDLSPFGHLGKILNKT